MPLLEWNDSLSIHVEEVDKQHMTLVDMVNRLHDSMMDKAGDEVLLGIVDEMRTYTVEHFATEERLMDQFNFPDALLHKAEHQDFVDHVLQVEADCKSGKTALSMDVLNFLSNWLVTHTQDNVLLG